MSTNFSAVDREILRGTPFRAFMSGGGLRVCRLGDLYYGEGVTLREALRILQDDIQAGGRAYGDVYGKIEAHYLTGQSAPDDDVDAVLRSGTPIEASRDGARIRVSIRSTEFTETPKDIHERVLRTGTSEEWRCQRGCLFKTSRARFPNGEFCTQSAVLSRPSTNTDPWVYESTRVGFGGTLLEALSLAVSAERVVSPRR